MSLKGINKKINDKEIKIRWSTEHLLRDSDSPLFCDKCHKRLGIIYMIRFSLFKKQGTKYIVKCRRCNHLNTRVKGQIGQDIDKDWRDYGV